MLNDFHRSLEKSRSKLCVKPRNHQLVTWTVSEALRENFHRPISSTVAAALNLHFRDDIPTRYAKVEF